MSALQEVPVCIYCREGVYASDAVFEAVCGHEKCPSAVFHGLCLMEWRERREDVLRVMQKFISEHPEFQIIEIEEGDDD